MENTTQDQVADTTTAPALSVDDQVKLANIRRDDLKANHTIECDRHNMQNARLQWIHRALETGNLGGTLFSGDQRQALLNRYGKMLLQFTRLTEDDQVVWPN